MIRDFACFCSRLFPSYPKPLFQSKAKCKAIDVKIIFYSHANKTLFHKKSFPLSLVVKVNVAMFP